VCCLYCGKEIGAFRLLRDSEFCSVLHRQKYGERLGKALHDIAAPEPAPASVAGFLVQMPLQQGNRSSTLNLWQTVTGKRVRIGAQWPLTIDISDATSQAASAPVPECPRVECPPQCERWLSTPAAEPVAAFVQASAAPTPVYTWSTPRFAAELEPAALVDVAWHAPAASDISMPALPPEAVTAFVQASAAPTPIYTWSTPRFADALEPATVVDVVRHAPAACERWLPTPAPEPVAAFVQTPAALAPAQALRASRFVAGLESAAVVAGVRRAPAACDIWMPAPAPEPVAAFVQTSVAAAPAHTLRLPLFAVEPEAASPLDLMLNPPPACERWMPSLAPESVAAFVQAAARLTPAPATFPLRLVAERAPASLRNANPAACDLWMPGPALAATCGISASATGPVYALSQAPTGAPPRIPVPEFAADLSSLPALEDLLEPPAMCLQWMPAPAADPLFSHLQTSVAQAVIVPVVLKPPALALSLAAAHVPWIAQSHNLPRPEPVMDAVWPIASRAPLALICQEAAIALPAIPQVARKPFAVAGPASAARPEAAESLLAAAQAALPVSTERAPCRREELEAPLAVSEPAPALCGPVAGLAPAALESLLVSSVVASMAPAVYLPPFRLTASQERSVPNFDAQHLAPPARKPASAGPRLVAPQPIPTLTVTPPDHAMLRLESGLPRPGLLPVEFHSHRLRSAPAANPEWTLPRPSLQPPRFLLRPIPEKLEDPIAQQKTARKDPGFVEILNMPAAKRPPTVLMVFGRVAAGFLLACSLWFGAANFRGNRQVAAREDVSSSGAALSADTVASSATASNGGTPAQPAPHGALARVRQAVANRATLRIAENFRGMENWDGAAKTKPAGWSRHPDGYMNTGALALFRPTVKFTDYRMEFFGQIETKSIGWTVRAKDAMNYHAMKLTVVEAGIRPFVALVHYNVVAGKSVQRTQTPLNIMVHNNRPMQFAVDVRGNRFVTSIDGEEVDSFLDNTLVAGGVGFFSEAGERARLYWMRVTRNDDWLGHVCAMLAEEAGANAAELRGPELPGGAPAPGLPDNRDGMTLSAMWIGLPYLGATRKAKFFKTRRTEPWNT
jgi:hypothetical protein